MPSRRSSDDGSPLGEVLAGYHQAVERGETPTGRCFWPNTPPWRPS